MNVQHNSLPAAFCLKCQAPLTFHTAPAQRCQASLSPGRPVVGGWGEEKVADISGAGCSTLDRAWDKAIHGINHYPVEMK